MRRILIRCLLALSLIAATLSCSRPPSDELYVRTGDGDSYEFEVAMDDDQYIYDLQVYVPMDCDRKSFASFTTFPITMVWQAPSGAKYEETVWMDREDLSASESAWTMLISPYRSSFRPSEYGDWHLSAYIPDEVIKEFNILGLGLKLKRNGTR